MICTWLNPGSDSSMDDCNSLEQTKTIFKDRVQIPLWTIVTRRKWAGSFRGIVQIPLWTIVTSGKPGGESVNLGSDSSMDDCNRKSSCRSARALVSSDSSMDDCNKAACAWRVFSGFVQIPLWTIVTRRASATASYRRVQIPLWTIVTYRQERRQG